MLIFQRVQFQLKKENFGKEIVIDLDLGTKLTGLLRINESNNMETYQFDITGPALSEFQGQNEGITKTKLTTLYGFSSHKPEWGVMIMNETVPDTDSELEKKFDSGNIINIGAKYELTITGSEFQYSRKHINPKTNPVFDQLSKPQILNSHYVQVLNTY